MFENENLRVGAGGWGYSIRRFILKAKRTKARYQEGLPDLASVGRLPLWKVFVLQSSYETGRALPSLPLALHASGSQPEVGLPSSGQREQHREATEERDLSAPSRLPTFPWHRKGASTHFVLLIWRKLPLKCTTPPYTWHKVGAQQIPVSKWMAGGWDEMALPPEKPPPLSSALPGAPHNAHPPLPPRPRSLTSKAPTHRGKYQCDKQSEELVHGLRRRAALALG